MRHTLLLAASAAAMMAAPALAQEEPVQATEPAEQPAVAATDQTATEGATEAQVVTATGGTDAAGGTPMQALALAAEQLQTVAQQIQGVGTGMATDGTAGGTVGLGTTEDAAAATTDGTTTTITTDGGEMEMRQQATQALDQFDQAVQQVSESPEGEPAQTQITLLQQQSQQVREQLPDDPQAASEGMQQLAQAAMQIQTAQIPAEADSIMGKQLVSSDGEEAGEVEDVLVTADGQVNALVIGRGGALGLGSQKVAIQWDQVQVQGDQLTVSMTSDQIDQLPEYQVD